jgi:hypothetical protein
MHRVAQCKLLDRYYQRIDDEPVKNGFLPRHFSCGFLILPMARLINRQTDGFLWRLDETG